MPEQEANLFAPVAIRGKPALELALSREPENLELREHYRSLLVRINRTTFGFSTIVLPELSYPLPRRQQRLGEFRPDFRVELMGQIDGGITDISAEIENARRRLRQGHRQFLSTA